MCVYVVCGCIWFVDSDSAGVYWLGWFAGCYVVLFVCLTWVLYWYVGCISLLVRCVCLLVGDLCFVVCCS